MIRKTNVLALITVAAVGMGPAVFAQEGLPKATPKAEQSVGEAGIRELIAALGAEEHAARQDAERALTELGDAARKLLAEAAEEHDDPEVRWRARRVLRVLDGEQPRLERRGAGPGGQEPGGSPRAGELDARLEEVMKRLERAFGEDFGRLRGLEDMQRQLEEMRRQFEEMDRRIEPGVPRVWGQGVPGAVGQGVQIQMGPDGVKVEVQEKDADGETKTRTYEADDMEAFRQEYPEIADRYFRGGGGRDGGFRFFDFGRARFEDTDGDGLPDVRVPGLRPFQDSDGDGLPDRRAPGFRSVPLEEFQQPFDVVPAPVDPPAEGERLGVYLGDLAPAVRDFLGIDAGVGLLVESLESGSLASELGIRPRDIVLEIGGRPIGDPVDVRAALRAIDKGEEVVVRVNRMGEALTLKATKIHAAPADGGKLRKREPADAEAPGRGR